VPTLVHSTIDARRSGINQTLALAHLFVHRRRVALCVRRFPVVRVMAAACRTTGHAEDDHRDDEADPSHDHENDPDRGNPEPVALTEGLLKTDRFYRKVCAVVAPPRTLYDSGHTLYYIIHCTR
jgi:hypothetical protein